MQGQRIFSVVLTAGFDSVSDARRDTGLTSARLPSNQSISTSCAGIGVYIYINIIYDVYDARAGKNMGLECWGFVEAATVEH